MSEKQPEKQKMLAGELYRSTDAELVAELSRAQRLLREFNAIPNEDVETRFTFLQKLFGHIGEATQIRSPFFCDYGSNISMGGNSFVNYNCVFLDCNRISIGDYAQIAPGVHIYTAWHPLDPGIRESGLEAASPVIIGRNVWIGGGALICPGVTIGDDSVIGAGSVVTRDIAARSLAVGNPCRVVRSL
ncbi:MAG TPA: sugar O-acetyltransferase [Terriglobales bacterium]|nr:sugar O-acetyltransferase [Terriglobales bacterium]